MSDQVRTVLQQRSQGAKDDPAALVPSRASLVVQVMTFMSETQESEKAIAQSKKATALASAYGGVLTVRVPARS